MNGGLRFRTTLCSLLVVGAGCAVSQETAAPEKSKPAWKSELPPLPEITPATAAGLDAAIRRGADYLISSQNANGSWGGPTKTKGLNIYAPIPGAHHAFRSGTSGLALYGLLKSRDQRPEAKAAIDMAEAWFLKELPRLRRAEQTTTYNVWGHAYGLRALCALYEYRAGDEPKRSALRALGQQQVDLLLLGPAKLIRTMCQRNREHRRGRLAKTGIYIGPGTFVADPIDMRPRHLLSQNLLPQVHQALLHDALHRLVEPQSLAIGPVKDRIAQTGHVVGLRHRLEGDAPQRRLHPRPRHPDRRRRGRDDCGHTGRQGSIGN